MRYTMIILALLALAGCTRESADYAAPEQPSSVTEGSGTMAPGMDAASSSPTAGTSHAVHLVDYEIHMPQEFAAGRVVFNVENGGKEEHAFEVEGNGVHQETEVLTAGNRTTMEVNLAPGTYKVYCPVGDHEEKGMTTTITVR
jgi:uncharacterized cupredoxin-like copper-binding protein